MTREEISNLLDSLEAIEEHLGIIGGVLPEHRVQYWNDLADDIVRRLMEASSEYLQVPN